MTTTAKMFEIRRSKEQLQIVDRDDGYLFFQSNDPCAVAAEMKRLTGSDSFLWELEEAKRYCKTPHAVPGVNYVGVYLRIEACDKNIDRVRALYRAIKGRELDESRSGEQGYYRYPAGPRNADPEHERRFGHLIDYQARYYTADGKRTHYDRMEVVINLLRAGYDLGYNDLK